MEKEIERLEEGPKAKLRVSSLRATLKKYQTPGHDGIHGYWFKKFISIHHRLATEMNRCLQETFIPEWTTKGKTSLIQKDLQKRNRPNNYRPITCLRLMVKILTAKIKVEINDPLTYRRRFPNEQKECRKWTRWVGELIYIDQLIL